MYSKSLTKKAAERTKAIKQAEIVKYEDRQLELKNAKGERVTLKRCEWEVLLKQAERFGWQPRGTNAPPAGWIGRGDWSNSYTDGAGEWMDTADCANLAETLKVVIANGLPPAAQPLYKKLIALLAAPGVTITELEA